MIALDNTALSLLLHPEAEIPNDPSTDLPVSRAQDRMQFLVENLQESGTRILIPAPALGEFLTVASADYLTDINQSMWFEVGPFDQRAAIESAIALRRARSSGKGKKLGLADDWQKIKVDRQIVAIAKIYEVSALITTDAAVITIARECGLEAIHVADLPLPPADAQPTLPLESLIQPSSSSPTAPSRRLKRSPGVDSE